MTPPSYERWSALNSKSGSSCEVFRPWATVILTVASNVLCIAMPAILAVIVNVNKAHVENMSMMSFDIVAIAWTMRKIDAMCLPLNVILLL